MSAQNSARREAEPLISVITPAYNAEHFIAETVRSVQAQTFDSWEMVIADDSSRDGTAAMLADICAADLRIRVIRLERGRGPAGARNAALAAARGRYICFLDSDDLWLPDKLKRQLEFMRAQGCALSHTAYRRMSEDGRRVGRLILPPERLDHAGLLKNAAIANATSMVDTGETGALRINETGYRAHDYILWLALTKRGFAAHGLTEDLARYRAVGGSISSNRLRSAYWVWRIYRDIERLSARRAAWCLTNYGLRALIKRLGHMRPAEAADSLPRTTPSARYSGPTR